MTTRLPEGDDAPAPNSYRHGMSSANVTDTNRTAPTLSSDRITNLDSIRGFAVLGILVMNAVSFGLAEAAYFNLDAQGSEHWLDWLVGGAGEILIDQKTMGLFSMLFGAGIVLFAERAEAKGTKRPLWLSLQRNGWLLVFGIVHSIIWEGDVLSVYALCAPLLLIMRKRSIKTLIVSGTILVLVSAIAAVIAQAQLPADGTGLSTYWFVDPGHDYSDAVGIFLLTDFFSRAAGMMLIGVALYRLGILNGERAASHYRRMTLIGFGVGLPIAAAGLALQVGNNFSSDIALIGEAPNTLATIPMVFGYIGAISLWTQRQPGRLHTVIQATGRMALTNYLTQTLLGVLVLGTLFDSEDLHRSTIFVFVLGVWALQMTWSTWWLNRFRFGPFEWAWRCLSYRKFQPIR